LVERLLGNKLSYIPMFYYLAVFESKDIHDGHTSIPWVFPGVYMGYHIVTICENPFVDFLLSGIPC
jgi:hypothetical protein